MKSKTPQRTSCSVFCRQSRGLTLSPTRDPTTVGLRFHVWVDVEANLSRQQKTITQIVLLKTAAREVFFNTMFSKLTFNSCVFLELDFF